MVAGAVFSGALLNAVDTKGRVSLPSSFRDVIDTRLSAQPNLAGSKVIKIGKHPKLNCLEGFDVTHEQKLQARLAAQIDAITDPEVDKFEALDEAMYDIFGAMLDVSYDAGGRMVLPPIYRNLVGISDLAFFIGGFDTFRIWNPEAFRTENPDKRGALMLLDAQLAERSAR